MKYVVMHSYKTDDNSIEEVKKECHGFIEAKETSDELNHKANFGEFYYVAVKNDRNQLIEVFS